MNYTCIAIDDEPYALGAMNDLIDRCPHVSLNKTFSSVPEALEYLSEGDPVDIIFSDINMPDINGLQAARLFGPYCRFLVFVTAYPDHSLQAFNVRAAGFLLKPVGLLELTELISSFKKNDDALLAAAFAEPADEHSIFIKGGMKNQYVRVNINDIVYIKADLNYNWIYTTTTKHYTYASLSSLAEKLEKKGIFIKVSKSVLVSTIHIEKVDGNTVHLSNKDCVTIGATFKASFHEFVKRHSINF